MERHPLVTNAIQGAALASAGDMVAQMYANRQQNGIQTLRPDWDRSQKAALVGVVNVGLWPYYWYLLVDNVLPSSAPRGLSYPVWLCEWSILILKIILDSAVNGAASIASSFSLVSFSL